MGNIGGQTRNTTPRHIHDHLTLFSKVCIQPIRMATREKRGIVIEEENKPISPKPRDSHAIRQGQSHALVNNRDNRVLHHTAIVSLSTVSQKLFVPNKPPESLGPL
ncbi:hypothetical protein Ancab_007579 [Ancistrocladus abbreviatus]